MCYKTENENSCRHYSKNNFDSNLFCRFDQRLLVNENKEFCGFLELEPKEKDSSIKEGDRWQFSRGIRLLGVMGQQQRKSVTAIYKFTQCLNTPVCFHEQQAESWGSSCEHCDQGAPQLCPDHPGQLMELPAIHRKNSQD